ncbi:DUF2946 family protein [Colwellia sp. UCD-KL20]|uniref:DUF2946 family protein n=1 Tax=Colwellia sp. UCD-KL20 TaxID=1917165 RepID=UPI00336C0973
MLKTPLTKLLLLSFILLCHLFSILMPASAAMNMYTSNMQDSDLAPICSGNGKIRWIKLSEYYQTGKLTFLEKPSISDETEQNNKTNSTCPICSIYTQLDNLSTGLVSAHSLTLDNQTYQARFNFLQHFTQHNTLTPSSRDPPSLI